MNQSKLQVDDKKTILVEFPNETVPKKGTKCAVGFSSWLSEIDVGRVDDLIKNGEIVTIDWPKCDVVVARKMGIILKTLDENQWGKHAVKILAVGNWTEMRAELDFVTKNDTLRPSKEKRHESVKRNLSNEEFTTGKKKPNKKEQTKKTQKVKEKLRGDAKTKRENEIFEEIMSKKLNAEKHGEEQTSNNENSTPSLSEFSYSSSEWNMKREGGSKRKGLCRLTTTLLTKKPKRDEQENNVMETSDSDTSLSIQKESLTKKGLTVNLEEENEKLRTELAFYKDIVSAGDITSKILIDLKTIEQFSSNQALNCNNRSVNTKSTAAKMKKKNTESIYKTGTENDEVQMKTKEGCSDIKTKTTYSEEKMENKVTGCINNEEIQSDEVEQKQREGCGDLRGNTINITEEIINEVSECTNNEEITSGKVLVRRNKVNFNK